MKKNKIHWYLSAWFIALLMFFSQFFIPLIVAPLLLIIFHLKKLKKLSQSAAILYELKQSGYDESIDVSELITKQKDQLQKEQDKLSAISESIKTATIDLEKVKSEYIELKDEVLLQSFGFFDPKYNLEDSAAYKLRLDEIRTKQKDMVKNKTAASGNENWTINGSKVEGKKMTNNTIKLAIRSFNNECDVAISKVTVSNVQSMEDRISKTFDMINKLNSSNQIQLKVNYLKLKKEELYLALEYAQKVEKEKEEQREIREQMREEEVARREIAKLKEKVEKEELHFMQALENLEKQKASATEEQLSEIELKISALQLKLKDILEQKEDVLNRERNTRAGYVYIISNIGAFGENIYKIGMTRRLEPLDRIKELGSASVPFLFDVHAMIFSEDAPTLENILHRTFTHKRLNLINERKEFFNVTLDEIESVVANNHDKTIEFTTTAAADDYRQTKALKEELAKKELVHN